MGQWAAINAKTPRGKYGKDREMARKRQVWLIHPAAEILAVQYPRIAHFEQDLFPVRNSLPGRDFLHPPSSLVAALPRCALALVAATRQYHHSPHEPPRLGRSLALPGLAGIALNEAFR